MIRSFFLIIFSVYSLSLQVFAEQNPCVNSLMTNNHASNYHADPQKWMHLAELISARLKGFKNPYIRAGLDPHQISMVNKKLSSHLPQLYDLTILNGKIGFINSLEFLPILVHIEIQIQKALQNKDADNFELVALQEAVRLIAQIEPRVQIPPETDSAESNDKSDQQDQQGDPENPQEENKDSQKTQWQQDEDEYEPNNVDVSGSGGKNKETIHIIETNILSEGRVLPTKFFDHIGLNKLSRVPTMRGRYRNHQNLQNFEEMLLRPDGTDQLWLPYVNGYEPLVGDFATHSVTQIAPGEFKFISKIKQESYAITIGVPNEAVLMDALSLSDYSKPVGTKIEEWPSKIQAFIKSRHGQASMQVANELVEFLKTDGGFLYYSKGDLVDNAKFDQLASRYKELRKLMSKPLAMAHLGAFKCDGAAWIAAILLKDFFGIPTRIISGRTQAGYILVNGVPHYVTKSTDPLHAWIQVWSGTDWVTMDPTPTLNHPKNNGQDTEELKPIPEKQKSSASDSEKKDAGKNKKDQISTKSETKTVEKSENVPKESNSSHITTNSDLKESGLVEKLQDSAKQDSVQQGWIKKYEIHCIERMIQDGNTKQILEKARTALSPMLKSEFLKHEIKKSFDNLIFSSDAISANCDLGFKQCLMRAQNLIHKGHARESYSLIRGLISQLETLQRLRGLNSEELISLSDLEKTLVQFRKYNHKNAKAFDLVDRFTRLLPGTITRKILTSDYRINQMTPDSLEVLNLAMALKNNKEDGFVRTAAMKKYAEMYIKSIFEPRSKDYLQLNRSLDPADTQDITMARSPLEINRMLLNPRPGEHLFAPLFQGRQFAIGPRQTIQIPDPTNPIEHKTIVVLVDVSPSMQFDSKNVILSSMLCALVDYALSEMDSLGRPINSVYLVPFNESVGKPTIITSREQAENFIRSQINNPTDAHGKDTDIQGAILEFYRLVATAKKERILAGPFRHLKHGSLVLFSDGQAKVDLKTLETAHDAYFKNTNIKIHMNFVAINGENPSLQALAEKSGLSTGKPTFLAYDESSKIELDNFIKGVDFDDKAFVLGGNSTNLASDTIPILQRLTQKPTLFVDDKVESTLLKVKQQLKIGINDADVTNHRLLEEFVRLTISLRESPVGDIAERRRIVASMLSYYEKHSGRPFRQMSKTEFEAVTYLLKSAGQ